MEKYSQFRDPLTGIHPFINPKYPSLSILCLPKLITRFIFIPLLLVFPFLLKFYIEIKRPKNLKIGTYVCNQASMFDIFILKYLYNANIYFLKKDGFLKNNQLTKNLKKELNIVFVEECRSNNSCFLRMVRNIDFDGIIILKYSNSCICMYGNFFNFLLRLLASNNHLNIYNKQTNDIKEFASYGLPLVNLGKSECDNFLVLVNKRK